MHLCIVSPFPPEISGIGQYGWHVAHGLARSGRVERVSVLSNHAAAGRDAVDSASPALAVRQAWGRDDPGAAPRLLGLVREVRPDVVWFNLGFSVFGASRAANFLGLATPWLVRRAGFPAVVTLHEVFEATPPQSVGARNGRVTAWGARAATQLLLHADGVCVTLGRYAAYLRRAYGAENVHHIPHGTFSTPELLPHTGSAPEILMLATHAPHKGLSVLLEAFEQVRRAWPQVRLTIAGSDHPRFAGYLAKLRERASGTPNIAWQERLSEAGLRSLFARASVVVVPYLATTGASSVVHRAAAWGRPLVVSDLPDFRALADEEGLRMDYAPPGEPGGLAAALLVQLRDPARQAAQAAHNLSMMQAMSPEQTSLRYVDVLERARAQAS